METGKIYPKELIETALTNFFRSSNLEKLWELTLRELASQIDLRRRETPEEESSVTPDQVMVCLSSRGPQTVKALCYASRLGGKLNPELVRFLRSNPSEEATAIDAQTQRLLSNTLTLAKQLGALVLTDKGEDIADTILRFAREYRVGHLFLVRGDFRPFWKRLGENRNI